MPSSDPSPRARGVPRARERLPSSEPSPRTARQIRIPFIQFIICKCELVKRGNAARCVLSTRHRKNYHRCRAVPPARESSEERAQLVEFTRQQKSGAERCNARIRSEKLNIRCTCCLLLLTLWSTAAGCNNRMPMCIGLFSLHSKWIGLSKLDPNSSVIWHAVKSDRLIGNYEFPKVFVFALF